LGADVDVPFDLGATPFPNVGFFSVPAPGGTDFTVLTAGSYEFGYYVVGVPQTPTSTLQFVLYVNGAPAGAAYEFRSNRSSGGADTLIVVGQGLIELQAGDIVTLHNRTNSGGDSVGVTNSPTGVNRSLSLKRIA
jgi:hypothetical protein